MPERVEQLHHPLGVRAQRERAPAGPVAAAVAEEVDEEHAVPLGEEPGDARPEQRRRREAVEQDHRLAAPARARRERVQPRPPGLDELAAHRAGA
jgi:hypothetical protein